jgi:hypothetical protein
MLGLIGGDREIGSLHCSIMVRLRKAVFRRCEQSPAVDIRASGGVDGCGMIFERNSNADMTYNDVYDAW